jgi:mitochondrial fission protein ELM1
MPMRKILRALQNGESVGIVSDQDGGKKGTFVLFFNRLSSTPAGVATFALRTGAPIFPGFIFREKNHRHRIEIEDPLKIPDASLSPEDAEHFLLQQFVDTLEKKIRKAPDQWLWAHRRWKSSPDRNVVILSDGKAGHLNQSLALYEACRRERQTQGFSVERFQKKIIEVHFRNPFAKKCWKTLGFVFRGHVPFAERLLQWALEPECAREVIRSYADIVISCGSALAEINLWMKRENLAKSMVVMNPTYLTKQFDAVIVPRHDRLAESENIFETDGALSTLDMAEMNRRGAELKEQLGFGQNKKCLGLLVGGDTPRLKFDEPLFEALMNEVRRVALLSGAVVLATSSRRTPAWADKRLKELFSDSKLCPMRVIANEVNRPGAVAGILGLSDVILVSGESMSMISEAVSSGKPVVVFSPWKKASYKRKYEDYLSALERKGIVRRCLLGNLEEVVNQATRHFAPTGCEQTDSGEFVLNQAAKRIFSI